MRAYVQASKQYVEWRESTILGVIAHACVNAYMFTLHILDKWMNINTNRQTHTHTHTHKRCFRRQSRLHLVPRVIGTNDCALWCNMRSTCIHIHTHTHTHMTIAIHHEVMISVCGSHYCMHVWLTLLHACVAHTTVCMSDSQLWPSG